MIKQKILALIALMIIAFGQNSQTFGQSGGAFEIKQSTVSNGGGNSSGSSFALDSTIGQAAAGQVMNGGGFSVSNGFWASNSSDGSTSTRTNVALSSSGGVASASSFYSNAYSPAGAINGDRKGTDWGNNGGWNDATAGVYTDWLQVDFNGSRTINEISVFTVQDNYANPSEPTENSTFTQYGITSFDVQYWTGSVWQTVPNGTVTNNNKVWSKLAFTPVTTIKIRVVVSNSLASYSRITELEAYEVSP